MASNSLLECVVFAKTCANHINTQTFEQDYPTFNDWDASRASPSKEKVMVSHLWDEIRRIMWNFVGIVRSNKRLYAAKMRLTKIQNEVDEYYHLYLVSSDLIELRNLITTAQITVESAISRTESRGLHCNSNHNPQYN
jgi:L-aspartate oxidase